LLIEDKIDAQCQPDQAHSYRERADRYVGDRTVSHAATVLVAPRGYADKHKDDVAAFDHLLEVETIREWLAVAETLRTRADFLCGFLDQVSRKFHRARAVNAAPGEASAGSRSKPQFPELHEAIRAEIDRTFPQLGVTNTTPGEWVYFSFPHKGVGATVRYRLRDAKHRAELSSNGDPAFVDESARSV
jgi:hypothetical protein